MADKFNYENDMYEGNGSVRQGIPAPGFSDRVNDPEILKAVKNNKKYSKIFAVVIVPIPLIGFLIYSFTSDSMTTTQGLLYGAIISFVFLICAVISFIKGRPGNSYEAVVTKKKTRNRTDSKDDNIYTEYITFVKTTEGKKKKIVETDKRIVAAFEYLDEGARFKYHPQFAFPYELYDKSKAQYIVCVKCGRKNPVEADRCKKCSTPLLK